MHKNVIRLGFLFLLVSCSNNDKRNEVSINLVKNPLTAENNAKKVLMPNIELDTDVYDFGEIIQGESVDMDFTFKNIGEAPLLIRSAKGSCGCTVPEWPKEPILVGESAVIKVTFNSEGKKGKQNKTVTLVTNMIPSTKVLSIKGNILVTKNKIR